MSYTITIVDPNEQAIDLELRKLLCAANYDSELLPKNFLAKNICSKASASSFFLVAYDNDTIIGCNGFLANDFLLDGIHYIGYQSCWTATHPDHQRKKVFSSIIETAKIILKEKGAGFLYGIANNYSNPILTKRLGFREIPSLVLRMPNIPFLNRCYFTQAIVHNNKGACYINELQVMDHKMKQSPDSVKLVKYNDSWLWGKRLKKRKFGFSVPVFYVGGICLAATADLKGLVSELFRSQNVLFVQFFSCESNRFNALLKGWKTSKMNGFIFFNFTMPHFDYFNLMIGPIDVF